MGAVRTSMLLPEESRGIALSSTATLPTPPTEDTVPNVEDASEAPEPPRVTDLPDRPDLPILDDRLTGPVLYTGGLVRFMPAGLDFQPVVAKEEAYQTNVEENDVSPDIKSVAAGPAETFLALYSRFEPVTGGEPRAITEEYLVWVSVFHGVPELARDESRVLNDVIFVSDAVTGSRLFVLSETPGV